MNRLQRKDKPLSISGLYMRFQLGLVILMILIVVGNFAFLYHRERKQIIADCNLELKSAVSVINTQMRGIEENLVKTMSTISSDYNGLWSEEFRRKFFDKQSMNLYLRDLLTSTDQLEMLYLYREDDYLLLQGGNVLYIDDRNELKKHLESSLPGYAEEGLNGKWMILPMEGQTFFMIFYYYADADLYLGAVFRPQTFLTEILTRTSEIGDITVTDSMGNACYYSKQMEAEHAMISSLEETLIRNTLQLKSSIYSVSVYNSAANIFVLLALIMLIGFGSIFLLQEYLKRTLLAPIEKLSEDVMEVSGYLEEQQPLKEHAKLIGGEEDAGTAWEIASLRSFIGKLINDTVLNRIVLYQNELKIKENQLTMYRSQLRPHFYLNAIMTIQAMTYQERPEDIRRYLDLLSRHIRYIIRMDTMTKLSDELASVENYFEMQDIRYPMAAIAFVDCPEELQQVRIPSLILQTVAENFFKYALGDTQGMQFIVSCSYIEEADFQGTEIVLEDNGRGFTPEQLAYYNREEGELQDSTHIGLSNVKNTLRLVYERKDLFHIENALPNGAKITIRIPKKRGNENETSDC